jgi:hypothetical protein
MNDNEKTFLHKVDNLMKTITELAEEYDVADRLAMVCTVAVVTESEGDEESMYNTSTNMLITDEVELLSMLEHVVTIYSKRDGYDFDDLFDKISLN